MAEIVDTSGKQVGASGLSVALKRSQSRASALTKSFFAGPLWDVERVAIFVNEVGGITIASLGPTGRPHAAFTIAGCVDDRLVFTVTDSTILRRNLEFEARIGFTVTGPEHSIMGQGVVCELAVHDDAYRIAPSGWTGSVWEIDPVNLVAG